MRVLFVADGRSPIALNWIRYFVERGDEVHLASTFACQPELAVSSLDVVPVAFSGLKTVPTADRAPAPAIWGASTLHLRTVLRQWLGPLTVPGAARRLSEIVERVRPDLIHAMRIPYEGMLAAAAMGTASRAGPALLVSVWGNDFSLHARSTLLMKTYTRMALRAANGLHADCQRDIRLAGRLGFPDNFPTLVAPGNGGIRQDVFYPPEGAPDAPVVVQPRGFRAYVRNDTFFQAIPLVLEEFPGARFLCPAMAGEREAQEWVRKLDIAQAVELLPPRSHPQMGDLFRSAQVAVSPTTHDGTPNTLLEAMACGCFPVAGDLESIREWIIPGQNGLLVDAGDPAALAAAILRGLKDPELRRRAMGKNTAMIAERAAYAQTMARVVAFYQRFF